MPRADVNARAKAPDIDVAWIGATASPARDGAASLLLAVPGDFATLEPAYATFRAAGSPAALRLDCSDIPLAPWAVGPIPEFAEREEACLVIDFGNRPAAERWAELVNFAREYPRLPMLALGMPLGSPIVGKALDASPNILLEAYDEPELATLCIRYGAYRFAWGSAGRPTVVLALQGSDREQVGWTTAAKLADKRWAGAHL